MTRLVWNYLADLRRQRSGAMLVVLERPRLDGMVYLVRQVFRCIYSFCGWIIDLTCCINPLAIDIDGRGEIYQRTYRISFSCPTVFSLASILDSAPGQNPQFIPHWNFCAQILHSSVPTPAFLSNLTETDFSWLQNRQVKMDGRGSF